MTQPPPRLLKKLRAARLRDLEHAQTYASWREIALELDQLEGTDAWRQDDNSDDYDHLLIKERLGQMRELRRQGRVGPLVFALGEGLHGNLGNLSNPALYNVARVGTKQLVTEYIQEVARCLDYLCAGDFPDFPVEEKIQFFKRTGTVFGRSALMLSGGATLGMFHLGVIKALAGEGLLPRVLSGSSAGAIIAGAAGTRTDAELQQLFEHGGLNLNAFQKLSLPRALRGGAMMDGRQLERCLNDNVGDVTFTEAFEHSRRIVGITVSPADPHQEGRLLNYLTAPNVLLRRAIRASCAVPGVFAPVMLEARNFDGECVPYMPSRRWVDGTLSADLPMLRLARLHNVNHYIVSQTNPHIVPFMSDKLPRRGVVPLAREMLSSGGRGALALAREHLDPYGAGRVLGKLDRVVRQKYSGDINLFPRHSPAQLLGMFSNPTPEQIQSFIRDGERATWPKIERIRNQTHISRTIEDCLFQLKAGLQATPRRRRA